MTMFYSSVLRLLASGDAAVSATHGHQVHAMFLDLVRQVDAPLAEQLHAMSGDKPFTVSALLDMPLHDRNRVWLPLTAGREMRLRVTMLDDRIFAGLLRNFVTDGALPRLTLGSAGLVLSEVLTMPGSSPWSGCVEPLALWRAASRDTLIALEFCSPTAFSLGEQPWGKQIDLLPSPDRVFDSLTRKWSTATRDISGLPSLDRIALRQWIAGNVVVKRIEGLNTRMLHFNHGPQVGFTGRLTYEIKGAASKPEFVRTLNALADFAFYSGVGYRTTMGMGQVRRVRT